MGSLTRHQRTRGRRNFPAGYSHILAYSFQPKSPDHRACMRSFKGR
jgi:hypothetical protein